ncbi:unnamed protein product [Porites lobata]|uniref:CHAT domain-containing protein n=1 Tax=Porites lobata TaxID=104759 RepID=A0ABN8S2S5_9CNID|nr:unnamed protein product [Porites lobata]
MTERNRIEYHEQQLSIAIEVGDRAGQGRAYANLGIACHCLGQFQQAIEYYKQHLSIAIEIGDRAGQGRTYGSLGSAYRSLGQFQQAIEYHKQDLSIAIEVGDRAGQGRTYGNLGIAYRSLGQFQQAIEYLKQSLSIAIKVGDRAAQGCAYCSLGVAYGSLGQFQQAIEYHKQYLSIAKEVGNRAKQGHAYGNLGSDYTSLGQFHQAIEYHKQCLSIAIEVGDRVGQGRTYGSLGNAYGSLGQFQQAIEYHKQDLSIAIEVGDRAGQGCAYGNLGVAYGSLGQFQQAIEYHKQDLSIAIEVGDRAGQGRTYCNLGNAYKILGQLQQAIEYYKQCLSIAIEVGDRAVQGRAYGNLGNAYLSLEDFEQSMKHHKKSLSIAIEVGNRADEGRAYGNIGSVYKSLGDFQGAIEHYKQSLSIAKEVGDRSGEGYTYGSLGRAYFFLKQFQQAIEYYKQQLKIAKEVGDMVLKGYSYQCLGETLMFSGSLDEAVVHFRFSVKTCDTIRGSFISEDAWKISFHELYVSSYRYLCRVLIALQKTDEALYAAERGRAGALLDALKIKYGLTSLSPISNETEEDFAYLLRNISFLTMFIALDKETISLWVLGKKTNAIFRQTVIKSGGAHEDPFGALLKASLKKIGAGRDVRCENRSLDVLSDKSTSSTRGDDKTSIPSHENIDWLQPLHDIVFGPIEDLLDGDELVVVPDGALCLAPWTALSETLRIRIIPSLTSLKVIRDSSSEYHSKTGALLVGDPCLRTVTDKWDKPIYEQLEFAKKEVEMIGKLLNSQPLTGEAATKEEVLRTIDSVALIHIAAHGGKEAGEIALAPNPGWQSKTRIPTEEDYMLKMSDLQAIKLTARLVVLSCCHSGQGEVSSEGVVGMARAFLFAGARSVLASLWAIDDEATMVFMECFYQHLRVGESASTALQKAMKCLRYSDDFCAPKYWAPFVLIGDDVTIEFDVNR